MYSKELKDSLSGMSMITLSKSNQKDIIDLRNEVIEKTSFLNQIQDVKITTRVYCIVNDVVSIPICRSCLGPTIPNKLNNKLGFSKYCSLECSRVSSNFSDEVLSKLSSYDWLFEQRISLKKSWDVISDELKVSSVSVKKYADKLGIPEVNYNKTEPSILSILENKTAMEELYETKTIYDIGNELGVSPSFVNVWLNKHGIEPKPSNSYPRKRIVVSSECQEVIDFIVSHYSGEIIINDRSLLGDGREIDIVVPEKKLAIEYNGVWSHLYRPWESRESLIKGPNYHRSKAVTCREKGFKLFMIWSDDWKIKNDIIRSMLLTKMGIVTDKAYARKCYVKEIEKRDGKLFLDENHLQGKDNASLYLGLFNGNELVSVMSFGRSRYNKKYKWELSRFSVRKNLSVTGGFSKLLSHFMKGNSGSIISYADFDHSHGEVYSKNGFTKIVENKASYWYVKKNSEIMEHRFKYRKGKISNDGDNRTEWEIMQSMGYNKIFDCGTIAFAIER